MGIDILLIRLGILQALLGLLLGIEWEVKHKAVGMKTSVVYQCCRLFINHCLD